MIRRSKKPTEKTARKKAAAKKAKAERKGWRDAKGKYPLRDALRRDFCHGLQCIVCQILGESRGSSECAHVGERGLGQKSSDFESVPLCKWHHTAGPMAHHKLGKRFWDWCRIDKDAAVEKVNRQYAKWLKERGGPDAVEGDF